MNQSTNYMNIRKPLKSNENRSMKASKNIKKKQLVAIRERTISVCRYCFFLAISSSFSSNTVPRIESHFNLSPSSDRL